MTQNPADITLTPAETLLASRIQFDPQVLCAVKSMVGRDVEPYYQFMYKGQKIVIEADVKMLEFVIKADGKAHWKGFTVKIESDYTRTWPADKWPVGVLDSLREILPAGYQAFLTGSNHRPDLTILKTTDPYDVLRVQETHGWDFQDTAYTSEDLARVLASWQQECCLNINGAGCNNVKLVLETLPDDLVCFAERVNFLCWELDEIMNGFGNYGEGEAENRALAEKLAAHLRETRRLYLWWD